MRRAGWRAVTGRVSLAEPHREPELGPERSGRGTRAEAEAGPTAMAGAECTSTKGAVAVNEMLRTLLASTARDLEVRFAVSEAQARAALTTILAGAGVTGWQGPAADAYRRQLDAVAGRVADSIETIRANREVAAWFARALG